MESAAHLPGEDEPEPFVQLGGIAIAAPLDEPPGELDKEPSIAEELDLQSSESLQPTEMSEAMRKAEAALKAAAELVHPQAEAAKAAAEEAMHEEESLAEAPGTLPASSSSDVLPPEHLPPPLDTDREEEPQTEAIEASDLRTVSQKSPPPLPPPSEHERAEPPPPDERPLLWSPGQRVVLSGLDDDLSYDGMTGVVQFHEDGAYSVQLDEGSVVKVVPEQLSPVTEEQAALPPLSLALPVQEDLPDRTSRNTGPSVTGRNSELDTLQSLHINAGSLMGRLLLSYSQQVTKRPRRLMFFYALVVAVPVIVGIIFRGFDLETNFNAFIKADGAAMRDREAFELALSEKKDLSASRRLEAESLRLWEVNGDWVEAEADEDGRRLEPEPENWTSAPGRRLKTLFLRKDLQLLYRAKNGNIMDEKALQDIQQIEEGLRNLPRWQDSCLNKITGDVKRFLCDPGISIVAMAFPTPTSASQGTVFLQFTWDGLGRDVISSGAVLAYMKTSSESGDASRDSRRYFPKTYQFPEIGTDFEAAPGALPTAARTKFEFHMTLGQNGDPINQVNQNIQKVKAEWNEMIVQEMLPYFKEVQKRENPQVDFYYASGDIDSIEINSTLFSDLLMAIGSILFVILYLRVHTGSWIVSITAFAIIFISVPCAYILTPAAKATIASFLSVFLITGIGCDVVFVFTDFWEQGHKLPLESRCMCMIVHAGESCLATSITTALSFFANLASALQPLREFGMFMGLCVMCAFFLVLLMMPPLLVAVEKQKESAKLRVVDISSGQGVAAMQDEQKKKKKQKGTVMQAILFRLMSGIGACPCVILACTGIFFLTSVICVVTNAKLSTGVPDIFPAWHNQVSSKEVLGMFSTEADLTSAAPARGSVCRAETVNGTSTANCNLFWCEAVGSSWSVTTTTTTTGTTRMVSCLRSPIMRLEGSVKISLGDDTESCESISVYSRVASSDAVTTAAWTSTLTGALNDEIAPTSYSLAAIPISSIKPLVIENWETGKVEVSDFWQSARVNALAPFRQVSVNSNDTVTCEMHVLCFEAQRYKCGISGWTQLGSDTYTLGRRLAARRLQSLGVLVRQTVPNPVDVSVLWGIRSARYTPLVGPPSEFWSYDPSFQPQNPWAQRAIRAMCSGFTEDLKVYRAKCWIVLFEDFLKNRGRRFPSRAFDEDVVDWYYSNIIEAQSHLWFENRKVIACKLQFYVNVPATVPSSEGLKFMYRWDAFVEAKNAQASMTANAAWHTASIWVRSEAERAIIGSTIDTIIIATISGWAGVFVFTFDLWLAVIVTSVVLVVITGLAFFITCIMALAIGPIEVISLVVFVGYSVTYALHIAHNYNQMRDDDKDLLEAEAKARKRVADRAKAKAARRPQSEDPEDWQAGVELSVQAEEPRLEEITFTSAQLREARTRVAVLHVGGATLSSALSTAGSSAFLLFCTLTIFVKLGAVVVAVTVLSIVAAIVTLPAALIKVGPAPDAWYKRKARQLMQMLTGKPEEQEQPLLEEDSGVRSLS